MQERDYIILFDENGQPYIEHGVFDRLKNSKYYQKIKTGYGWRYFYDPAEWQAYVNGQGNAPKSLIGKAKDKLGFDELERYKRAVKKASSDYVTYKKGEDGYDKAWETGNYAFGRRGDSVTVKKTPEQIHEEGVEENARRREYMETPIAKVKSKFDRMKEELTKDAKYVEYTENDPDFNDDNYKEENRVGDSDFFIYKKPNGQYVILEEDMKWVLPKGVDPNSPQIKSAIERSYFLPGGTHDEWVQNVSSSLNEAIKASKNK